MLPQVSDPHRLLQGNKAKSPGAGYELDRPEDIPPVTTLPKREDYFGQIGESDLDDNTPDSSADSFDDEIVSWTGDSDDEQDMPTLDQDSSGEEFDSPSPDLSQSPMTSLYSFSNTNTVDDVSSKPSLSREYQYDPPANEQEQVRSLLRSQKMEESK